MTGTPTSGSAERIGVFGSAFDPPHDGHLALVEAARGQLGLDRVIVVPTGEPYHKARRDRLPAATRLRLAEAAFDGVPETEVSPIEVERPGPSYTVDTLERLSREHPGAELWLILGVDAAAGIGSWRAHRRVLELARLGVAMRAGWEQGRLEAALEEAGAEGRHRGFELPPIDVSSTDIRSRIASGEPWRDLVPAEVARIIDNEGLYADR